MLTKIEKAHYNSDSFSIILDIKNKIMLQERSGKEITVMWLPRCSVSGSSKADNLAKQSGNADNLESILPNYASLAPEINGRFQGYLHQAMAALYEKDIKKNYTKNSTYVRSIKEVENLKSYNRKDAVRFSRLISGYVADPEFLFKIKIISSKSCVCSSPSCNLDHVLWHCTQYLIPRYTMQEKLKELGYSTFPPEICGILANRDNSAMKIIFEYLDAIEFKI